MPNWLHIQGSEDREQKCHYPQDLNFKVRKYMLRYSYYKLFVDNTHEIIHLLQKSKMCTSYKYYSSTKQASSKGQSVSDSNTQLQIFIETFIFQDPEGKSLSEIICYISMVQVFQDSLPYNSKINTCFNFSGI